MGRPADMLVYARRKRYIRDYACQHVPHAEAFLRHYLRVQGIGVLPIKMRFLRYRANHASEPLWGLRESPMAGYEHWLADWGLPKFIPRPQGDGAAA